VALKRTESQYWSLVAEIILVWNGGSTLIPDEIKQAADENSVQRSVLVRLVAFEDNNLLNRYHPSLKPSTEAVMFLDDDDELQTLLEMKVARFGSVISKSNVVVSRSSLLRCGDATPSAQFTCAGASVHPIGIQNICGSLIKQCQASQIAMEDYQQVRSFPGDIFASFGLPSIRL